MKTRVPHAIERAKERYNLDLNELDLAMIVILARFGLGKEIFYPSKIQHEARLFNMRYGGKLVQPVILNLHDKNAIIVTFKPTGKKVSYKKYLRKKFDKDYLAKQKRIKK